MSAENEDIKYVSNGEAATELISYKDIYIYKSKTKMKVEKVTKRAIDIIGGIVGVASLVPLAITIKIANYISGDKGPLIFTQERIGKDGKMFKVYKFRSMVIDADEKLKDYLEENEEAKNEYKMYKKMKNDPRITKIGKFIRRTSLDEFPQFINVLKGDMSLVGPRPYLEREKDDMSYFYKYIVSCKPGITGLWQISGRSGVTFEDRIHIDMEYFKKHNLKVDLKILGKTLENIVKKEGAI